MTREELMALLRNPDQTGQSVEELNRLIEEYSYFHTGHQLYLQGLKQTGDTRLVPQLNKSALNVRDRNLLYNYINRPSLFRQQTQMPQDDIGEVVPPYAPGNAYVSPETDITRIHQSEMPDTISSFKSEQPLSLGMEGMRHESDEYILAEEKIMSDAELMKIIQRQLQQIESVKPDQAETEAKDQTVSQASDVPVGETGSIASAVGGETIPPVENVTEKDDTVSPEIEKIENTLASGNAVSANDFVSYLAAQKTVDPEVENISQQELSSEKDGEGVEQTVASTASDSVDSLIDSFLKSNPRIVPTDSNYEVDLTDSLHENPDIATETLADIYVSQGHIQKAIEIYEHLILKYPEKHIYFAAQIDRLKQDVK